MKRNTPSTSHDAYAKAKPMIESHYAKIMDALKVMKSGTAEQIAIYLKMDHSQINRRVSEMEKLQLIYKPGIKKKTKTGREAFVWCIVGTQYVETENLYASGQKTSTDYSKELIRSTSKKHIMPANQEPLFK